MKRMLSLASFLLFSITARSAEPKVRVLIWDEQQPNQKKAYENFLGNAIADYLMKQPGFEVKSVNPTMPMQGLDPAVLKDIDVVVWWGHSRHQYVEDRRADDLVARVQNGEIGLVVLHSAHFSKPFMRLMNDRAKVDALKQIPEAERATAQFELVPPQTKTPKKDTPLTPSLRRKEGNVWELKLPLCVFPAWREDGAPSHVRVLDTKHPLAARLPEKFDIGKTEMYDGPFHVPAPDQTVFEESWDKGEKFQSGLVWKVGKGRVVYFRPGHETYPVYRQQEPLQVVENACRWLGEEKGKNSK